MIILSFYSHTLDGGDFVSLLYKEVDDFEAYAYHQKQFKKVTKKDLLGKWTLFFFYPADFTFVCPTELEDLQEKYQEFKKVNCEIYAISTDTHFAHKTQHDISENISKIEYPMIGDPTHTLTYDFDVFDENDGLAQRGSFIIDPEGKIVVYEVNAGNVGRNADELLRRLHACQFVYEHGDNVCPAKWKLGEKTIQTTIENIGKQKYYLYDKMMLKGGNNHVA